MQLLMPSPPIEVRCSNWMLQLHCLNRIDLSLLRLFCLNLTSSLEYVWISVATPGTLTRCYCSHAGVRHVLRHGAGGRPTTGLRGESAEVVYNEISDLSSVGCS